LSANAANPDLTAIAGYAEVNLSRCRMAAGDLVGAEDHLRRGTRLLRSVGARGLLIEARLQLAELRLEQGRASDALREARSALAEAKAMDARLTEASAERIVGSAEAALGRHAEALARVEASVTLARRIGADLEEARGRVASARISVDAPAAHRPRGLAASLRRAEDILARMGAQGELEETRLLLALLTKAEPAVS
jgi:tetratricopeptide (TPR) repeat protein